MSDSNASPRSGDPKGDATAPGGGGDAKVRVMKQGLDQGVSWSKGARPIILV